MSLLRLSTLALAISSITVNAQSNDDDALRNLCKPIDSTNNFDWNAPCNALASIQYECMYGVDGRLLMYAPAGPGPRPDVDDPYLPEMQPYQAQRACICQSQHSDMLYGCMRCLESHGGVEGEDWFSDSKVDALMKSYCDAESPVTDNYAYLFYYSLVDGDKTATPSTASASELPSTVANVTDVSLYFTPSITGTPAYIPALPTPLSSGGNVTYTDLKTSGGLIVPTASQNGDEGGNEDTASATTSSSSEGGAMPAITAHPEVVRALGLAALFAVL